MIAGLVSTKMLLEKGQDGDYLTCFISFTGIESTGLETMALSGHLWKRGNLECF
jgi:hypothetical protein